MHPQSETTEVVFKSGSVVQLVRIHACHAWGRGFESRPDRIFQNAKLEKALIPLRIRAFLCVEAKYSQYLFFLL